MLRNTKGRACAWLLLGLLSMAACDRELPTGVGGEHLPESALRTYEILLPADAFLIGDSTIGGFGTTGNSSALVVANDWADTLDAHALLKFGAFPQVVTYADSSTIVTDTVIRYVSGRLVLRVDTTSLELDSMATDTSITFEAYAVTESFDTRTATWRARSVTPAGDSTFWSTPGGTTGTLIGTGTWVRSDTIARDSMVIPVDSAQVAAWAADTATSAILIRTTSTGARAFVSLTRLELNGRFRSDPDTTRRATAAVVAQTWIFDPPPPAPVNELRMGGRSAWRSYLMFRPGLDTVTVVCPDGPAGCSFEMGEATINRAELLLEPLFVSPAFRPFGFVGIEARPILGDEDLALERAPVADTAGVRLNLTAETFDDTEDDALSLGVTPFVRQLFRPGSDTLTVRERTLALLGTPEPYLFGLVRFGGLGTAEQPMLRLIVTVLPHEEED